VGCSGTRSGSRRRLSSKANSDFLVRRPHIVGGARWLAKPFQHTCIVGARGLWPIRVVEQKVVDGVGGVDVRQGARRQRCRGLGLSRCGSSAQPAAVDKGEARGVVVGEVVVAWRVEAAMTSGAPRPLEVVHHARAAGQHADLLVADEERRGLAVKVLGPQCHRPRRDIKLDLQRVAEHRDAARRVADDRRAELQYREKKKKKGVRSALLYS